jgi:hypothetical protein
MKVHPQVFVLIMSFAYHALRETIKIFRFIMQKNASTKYMSSRIFIMNAGEIYTVTWEWKASSCINFEAQMKISLLKLWKWSKKEMKNNVCIWPVKVSRNWEENARESSSQNELFPHKLSQNRILALKMKFLFDFHNPSCHVFHVPH